MINVYLSYILGLLISAPLGSFILYFAKKQYVDESIKPQLDAEGILERSAITILVILGSYSLILIPMVILMKAAYYLIKLKALRSIFIREEPGMISQKVKIKGALAIDLIGSPAYAVIVGLLLKTFMV